jgi:uncharacterized protein YegP (UPF0339 family)
MAAKFELKDAKGGQFAFVLKAANGEPILSSETYKTKSGAMNGIESVQTNAGLDTAYEAKMSKDKHHYFVVKAANHQIIGNSEMYSSESAMKDGIAAVKKAAPGAKVEDITK